MNEQQRLMQSIREMVYTRDSGDNLTVGVKDNMVDSLYHFVVNSTEKFIAGQAQHGGDIRDRDLPSEIAQEHIDMFWYSEAAFRWPNKP